MCIAVYGALHDNEHLEQRNKQTNKQANKQTSKQTNKQKNTPVLFFGAILHFCHHIFPSSRPQSAKPTWHLWSAKGTQGAAPMS